MLLCRGLSAVTVHVGVFVQPPAIFAYQRRGVSVLDHLMGDIDLILVMSVNPGFGGQSFIESQLDKIRTLRAMITASGRDIELEVDGGVNRENAARIIEAGASMLVAGTATFKGGPTAYADNIAALRTAKGYS